MTPELDTRRRLDTLDGLTARRAYFSYGLVLLLWRLDVRPGLDRHPHRPPRSRRDWAVEEKASMLRSRGRSHIGSVIVAASSASREAIWVYCLGCAVPVTLLAFRFARSALVRPVLGAVG